MDLVKEYLSSLKVIDFFCVFNLAVTTFENIDIGVDLEVLLPFRLYVSILCQLVVRDRVKHLEIILWTIERLPSPFWPVHLLINSPIMNNDYLPRIHFMSINILHSHHLLILGMQDINNKRSMHPNLLHPK